MKNKTAQPSVVGGAQRGQKRLWIALAVVLPTVWFGFALLRTAPDPGRENAESGAAPAPAAVDPVRPNAALVRALEAGAARERAAPGAVGLELRFCTTELGGGPGAALAGVEFRWLSPSGKLNIALSDADGRVVVEAFDGPLLGLARAEGHADRSVYRESMAQLAATPLLLLEPTAQLVVELGSGAELDWERLDPRCDPIWTEGDRSATQALGTLRDVLRLSLQNALSQGESLDADSRNALFEIAREFEREARGREDLSLVMALGIDPKPVRVGDELRWSELPARVDWIWSISRPIGRPLPPERDERLDPIPLELPPLLAGRITSFPLKLAPGTERRLRLDVPSAGTVWLRVPTWGESVAKGEVFQVSREPARLLARRKPDSAGLVVFEGVYAGEHRFFAAWESGPDEWSFRVFQVELAPGGEIDLGIAEPLWRTSVVVDVHFASESESVLLPEELLADSGRGAGYLQWEIALGMNPSDSSVFSMPAPVGSPLRVVGLPPRSQVLRHSQRSFGTSVDTGVTPIALRSPWVWDPPKLGQTRIEFAPEGQTLSIPVRVERRRDVHILLRPPPEAPFSATEWMPAWQIVHFLLVSRDGESVKSLLGSAPPYSLAEGEYLAFVGLAPAPGGAGVPAGYEAGMVALERVQIRAETREVELALGVAAGLRGHYTFPPRASSPLWIELASGIFAPMEVLGGLTGQASESGEFSILGLPPSALVRSEGADLWPNPLHTPQRGWVLDGVQVVGRPRAASVR